MLCIGMYCLHLITLPHIMKTLWIAAVLSNRVVHSSWLQMSPQQKVPYTVILRPDDQMPRVSRCRALLIFRHPCRIQEEHYRDTVPAGRSALFHKPLQTPKQHRAADVAAAQAHLARLGWSRAEVAAGQVDSQLDALIARAHAMQGHAKRLESLAPHSRAFQHPPTFTYGLAPLPSYTIYSLKPSLSSTRVRYCGLTP